MKTERLFECQQCGQLYPASEAIPIASPLGPQPAHPACYTERVTRERWLVDMENIGAIIEKSGALVQCEDGYVGIDQAKAPEMARLYGQLTSVGYAKGWL